MMELEDNDYIYRLVGVNVHRGGANRGHYWSLINTKRGDKENIASADRENEEEWLSVEKDTWKKFDDSEVKHFSFKDLEGESFGGDLTGLTQAETDVWATADAGDKSGYGKSAYMLVYERKTKNQIRQVVKKDDDVEAEQYFASQEKQTDAAMADAAAPKDGQLADNDTTLVDYRSIKSFVPQWIH
jgi:hypothetical protein